MTSEKFRPRPAIGQNIYFSLERNTFQIVRVRAVYYKSLLFEKFPRSKSLYVYVIMCNPLHFIR